MRIKMLILLCLLIGLSASTSVTRAALVTIPDGDVAALIAAINDANTGSFGNIIELAPGGTYTLTAPDNGQNGFPVIATNLTIKGNGATIQRAPGSPEFRFFEISQFFPCEIEFGTCPSYLFLNNLTLRGGSINTGLAYGGAIKNTGALQMENMTFVGNSAQSSGGAISNTGDLVVVKSTFANNSSPGAGAIYNSAYHSFNVSIVNSTFSNNTNHAIENSGWVWMQDLTFVDNGITLWNRQGQMSLQNSILTTTSPLVNCQVDAGNILSQYLGPNLENGDSCGFDPLHNFVNTDPLLGPLVNNGGPTSTHALLPGSPAIDTGHNCPLDDQRGQGRPTDGDGDGRYGCDIGAFEVTGSGLTFKTPSFYSWFYPDAVNVGDISRMEFYLINPSTDVSLTEVAFSVTFDPGLIIASDPGFQNTCGGTAAFVPGGSTLQFQNGVVAPQTDCTLSIVVQGVTAGYYPLSVQLTTRETGDSFPLIYMGLQVGGEIETTLPTDGEDPTVSACADLDGSTNAVVTAEVPPGLWGVYCRVITDNLAEIGNQDVIDRGVLQAVDVFSPNGEDLSGTKICLEGVGSIIFLDASQSPRVPQELASSLEGGYTCAVIPGAGMVVLVNAAPSGEAEPEISAQPVATSIVLTGCQVTTTNMVRLRAEPDAASPVITTLPYQLTLNATDRTGDWFHVVYLDGQGWVSGAYLTPSASC